MTKVRCFGSLVQLYILLVSQASRFKMEEAKKEREKNSTQALHYRDNISKPFCTGQRLGDRFSLDLQFFTVRASTVE
ncbi:unnamed protein product [Urochloa humidicola]